MAAMKSFYRRRIRKVADSSTIFDGHVCMDGKSIRIVNVDVFLITIFVCLFVCLTREIINHSCFHIQMYTHDTSGSCNDLGQTFFVIGSLISYGHFRNISTGSLTNRKYLIPI